MGAQVGAQAARAGAGGRGHKRARRWRMGAVRGDCEDVALKTGRPLMTQTCICRVQRFLVSLSLSYSGQVLVVFGFPQYGLHSLLGEVARATPHRPCGRATQRSMTWTGGRSGAAGRSLDVRVGWFSSPSAALVLALRVALVSHLPVQVA